MTALEVLARAKSERRPEVHLSMMGDWGVANWHQMTGWIAAGLRWRTDPKSTFVIHTLGPYRDTLEAVIDGTCDLCISSPISDVHMARLGRARFAIPRPDLCAIGVYPHHDRLMLGIGLDVAERYGLGSFADIREKQPALRLVAGVRDGINMITWTAEQVLLESGIAWDDIPRWGGAWVTTARPHEGLAAVANGQADGIFFEAMMNWHRVMEKRPLRLIPIDLPVLATIEREYGILRGDIQPGELPGVEAVTPEIEFSDWIVVVKSDMDPELAGLIAEVLIDERSSFEKLYTHRALKESPLTYPVDPQRVGRTAPVPLHPGAECFYRARGLLDDGGR